MKTIAYSLTAALALVAWPLQESTAAGSQPPNTTVATVSGTTTIEFDLDLLDALDDLDINVRALAPMSWCSADRGSVTLPIIGGVYDPESSTGEIIHRGGVVLRSDDARVVLTNLIVEVNEDTDPVISGLVIVDGALQGRQPLFNVDFADSDVRLTRTLLKLSNVDLTLTQEAAAALNTAFGGSNFAADAVVGEADISATLRALSHSATWLDPSKHHKKKHKKGKKDGDDDDDDDD